MRNWNFWEHRGWDERMIYIFSLLLLRFLFLFLFFSLLQDMFCDIMMSEIYLTSSCVFRKQQYFYMWNLAVAYKGGSGTQHLGRDIAEFHHMLQFCFVFLLWTWLFKVISLFCFLAFALDNNNESCIELAGQKKLWESLESAMNWKLRLQFLWPCSVSINWRKWLCEPIILCPFPSGELWIKLSMEIIITIHIRLSSTFCIYKL